MIDPTEVEKIFTDCLFKDEEIKDGIIEPVVVEGIMNKFGLHPERLKSHAKEVAAMLEELPEQFHRKSEKHPSGGDGWSFLNACNTKDGEQWTGFHRTMELLFVLGIGLGYVDCPMPRDMWMILPGGVPYYR